MRALILIICLGSPRMHAVELKDRLEKVLSKTTIARAQLGLAVFEAGRAPQTLAFALNEQKDLIPASVTKLATAAAVLERLGPSFKFQTTLWSSGTVKDGVLNGDLVLKGGGDAGFVSETMWFLVNEFSRRAITRVQGDVIVDESDFDDVRVDASRESERVDRAYDAPVGAMSFNWNSLNIFVRPTGVGEPAAVTLDPVAAGAKLDAQTKTVAGAQSTIEVTKTGAKVRVRGTIGVDAKEVAVYKNIEDPAAWSGANLIEFLGQRGIKVSGKVTRGRRPDGAKLLAKAESKPVGQHVLDMMKFSNNFVAEMLTKNLAAQAGVTPATLAEGMKLIRAQVVAMGVAESRFTLLNPSGLNRKNRIKPIDLALLLISASRNFPWFAEYLTALPLAGLDGTLKKRMKESPAQGWVRAKTGHLNGVTSLAGYAGRKDGSMRAFAFIHNGQADQGDVARRLFDQLAAELVQ